ncbi:MAG: ABC transporter ATP-binding protein [Kofleriaceae bacterium]|nr:ABC transporter ATP-binding protein [Kofleriaceae bacterium]MBP6840695.1 ABC transporter ATP-binding protein [Kofleriaceae bacterium]MBP9203267.1 ABC transporter ATP-binding protein [Kofleriaceae bacterium]
MPLDLVRTDKLVKRFGEQRALAAVSLELRAGSVCALLGHNGAGKTTLLGIVSTLVRASSGEVHYQAGGQPVEVGDDLRRDIGVLAHASLCYGELDAVENLRFFAGLYDLPAADVDRRITELLDEVGLEPAARTRPARTYSRGMWQRLSLARALLPRPTLLLLDEPFTGLDRDGAISLGQRLASLRAGGAIIVVVTHDLEAIAGVTDHVAVLRGGALVLDQRREAGTPGFGYDELKDLYHRFAQ